MKKLNGKFLILYVSILLLAIVSYILLNYGMTERGVGLAIRSTARTSIVLFLLAFVASAVHFFLKESWTAWLVKNRRYLGISFAISHYVHLAAVLGMNFIIEKPVLAERGFIIVSLGGVAYVFLTLMALTSTDNAIQKMGLKKWKRLHWIGSHYIWIVFANSYTGRAFTDEFYVPVAAALWLVMFLRVLHYVFLKRQKS